MTRSRTDRQDDSQATSLLARAAQEQMDPEAFGALYERVAPRFLVWARYNIQKNGCANRMTPEDLLHEVWLRAQGSMEKFRPEAGAFFTWIRGVAANVLLENLRRARTHPLARRDSGTAAFRLEEVPESVTSLTTRISRDDSLRHLWEQLQAYEKVDREIIMRCAIQGDTCRAVATNLGLSVDAVTKRWQRLRLKLRDAGWIQTLLLEHSLLDDRHGV